MSETILQTPKPIIAVIDIDCFEVQLWQKLNGIFPPGSLWNHPPTVVADSTGRILSVNPTAKQLKISRDLRVRQAQNLYPNLIVLNKPERWGKPSTKEVRDASYNILICVKAFLSQNTPKGSVIIEYKNGDEIFLNLTQFAWNKNQLSNKFFRNFSTQHEDLYYESFETCEDFEDFQQCPEHQNFFYGLSQTSYQSQLMQAGLLMKKLMYFVEENTGFKSSAGVACTKSLAKVACKFRKPEAVTILTQDGFHRIKEDLSVDEISGIGSTLQEEIEEQFGPAFLKVKKLANVRKNTLMKKLGDENGERVYEILQGTYTEDVIPKEMSYEVNCAKNNLNLSSSQDLIQAVGNLVGEMLERIEEERIRNRRIPQFINAKIKFDEAENPRYTQLEFIKSEQMEHLTNRILTKISGFGFIRPYDVTRIELTVREFRSLPPLKGRQGSYLIHNYG